MWTAATLNLAQTSPKTANEVWLHFSFRPHPRQPPTSAPGADAKITMLRHG